MTHVPRTPAAGLESAASGVTARDPDNIATTRPGQRDQNKDKVSTNDSYGNSQSKISTSLMLIPTWSLFVKH